jgi:hypothetical protein
LFFMLIFAKSGMLKAKQQCKKLLHHTGMKYLPKSSLKRSGALFGAAWILSMTMLSFVTTFIQPQQVKAQAVTYTYRNAGTIVSSNNETFYDSNPLDSIPEFGLAQNPPKLCNYSRSNPPISNLPYDRIWVNADRSTGTRHIIDESIKDNTQQVMCQAKSTPVTIANAANAQLTLYRVGDNVTGYNNAVTFSKTGVANGVEVFTRAGESGAQCPDLLVHGTSGDYNGWYLFPMAPRGMHDGELEIEDKYKAVSERYDGFLGGNGGSKENCRVRSVEIESEFKLDVRLKQEYCEPATGQCREGFAVTGIPGPGLDGNIFAYANYTVPNGWGDDGYFVKNGVGTQDNGPPAGAVPPPNGNTTSPTSLEPDVCDVAFTVGDIISLKWIVCPILDGLFSALGTVDNLLVSQLKTDMSPFDDGKPLHLAANAFRVVALGIIVAAALVMVIAQASGSEAVSALAVRKTLGNLGFALFLLLFIYPIARFVLVFLNDFSDGVRAIMYMPFGALEAQQLGGGGSAIIALFSVGAVFFLGPIGLLSLVGSAAAATGGGVFLLGVVDAIGKLIIIVLPIGVALWVLPNTRGGASFIKGVAMAVIFIKMTVAIVIPALHVIGLLIFYLGGPINQIMGIAIYSSSGVLVGFIIVKSGGAVAGILTFFSGGARAGGQFFSKMRGKAVQDNMAKAAAGKRFNHNILGINTATRGVAAFARSENKLGFISPDQETRRRTRRSAIAHHNNVMGARYAKTEGAQAEQHNDPRHQAQSYLTESEARANLGKDFGMNADQIEDAIIDAKNNGGFGADVQEYAVQRLFATGTGFKDAKQAHKAVARASRGNRRVANRLWGYGNTAHPERPDLKFGHGNHMALYEKAETQGGELTDEQLNEAYVTAALQVDPVTLGRGKTQALKNIAPAMAAETKRVNAMLAQTPPGGDRDRLLERAAQLNGYIDKLQQNSSYYSAANLEVISEHLGAPLLETRKENADAIAQRASPQVMEQAQITDAAGRVQTIERPVVSHIDPATGHAVTVDNPHYDDTHRVSEAANWQGPQGAQNSRIHDPRL